MGSSSYAIGMLLYEKDMYLELLMPPDLILNFTIFYCLQNGGPFYKQNCPKD